MNHKTISLTECQAYLKPRARTVHKRNFGHVLIVGGDYEMGGACRLAEEAALRAGTGLVSLAGDIVATQCGARGIIASDLLEGLRQCLN